MTPSRTVGDDTVTAPLVRFARALRSVGVPVGPGATELFCRACARLGPRTLDDVYWAGRSCLVDRAQDLSVYDAVFRDAFLGVGISRGTVLESETMFPATVGSVGKEGRSAGSTWEPADDPGDPGGEDGRADGTGASYEEALRTRSFEQLDAAERAAVEELIARLHIRTPMRRSRRTAPAARGDRIDLRRSLRAALRTDGEILRAARRARRRQPRRLVFLLDVSRSMAPYSRALLLLAYAAARSRVPVEAYCFGTRLTRVTRSLSHREPDHTLAAVARRVPDWDGGTRIGEALATFRRGADSIGVARGAIVVLCSDGLERSAVELLADEVARLGRLAHRLVWVNPLSGDTRYTPQARGMAAALPYVHHFVSGHNLSSIEALTDLLADLVDHEGWSAPGRYRTVGQPLPSVRAKDDVACR